MPNFSAIRPAVTEIRKRGISARAHMSPFTFTKRLANGLLTTHQLSAQSVRPVPRCGKRGISTRAHVRTCRCTPPMTCLVYIAVRSRNTHQIWSQWAEPFLSNSLATNFDTLHAARATRQGDIPNEPKSCCDQGSLNRPVPL